MQNKNLKRILACMLVTVSVITFSIPTFAGEGEKQELRGTNEISTYSDVGSMDSENAGSVPQALGGISDESCINTFVGSTRVEVRLIISPYQQIGGCYYQSAITVRVSNNTICDAYFKYEGKTNWGNESAGTLSMDQNYGISSSIKLRYSCNGEFFINALAYGYVSSDDGSSNFYMPLRR